MREKSDVISFARGFAIFTIVTMHLLDCLPLPNLLAKAIAFGGGGVHILFVCSGFGLYYSELNSHWDYAAYLKRRLFRLYLPYCVAPWSCGRCMFSFARILSVRKLSPAICCSTRCSMPTST